MATDARNLYELERRRTADRARRLLVVGACLLITSAGWLLLAWRASRVEATECHVFETPEGYCSASHRLDDETHELPHRACSAPGPWRGGLPPSGARVPCFYYPSFPSDIVFEAPEHRGPGPIPVGVLLVGAGLAALGLLRLHRARAPVARKDAPGHGYRAGAHRVVDSRAPLVIPLAQAHGGRWVFGGPFMVLGAALLGLSLYLAWQLTGDLDAGTLILLVFATSVLTGGLFGLLFRSGIVLDADENLAIYWWGLSRPWFRTFHPLDALTRVEAETRHAGRATAHFLTLHFAGERPQRHRMLRDEAERLVALIEAYCAPDCHEGGTRQGRT